MEQNCAYDRHQEFWTEERNPTYDRHEELFAHIYMQIPTDIFTGQAQIYTYDDMNQRHIPRAYLMTMYMNRST